MTDTTTANLAEWLEEQIAEDARRAEASAQAEDAGVWGVERQEMYEESWMVVTGLDEPLAEATAVHVANWDPVRVLAESEAKRKIIGMYRNAVAAVAQGSTSSRNRTADETAVDVLGSVLEEYGVAYATAGRPGYRPEWRPE